MVLSQRLLWSQVEVYMKQHSDVQFSHGFCPECYEKELASAMDSIRKDKK